jgi:hypothetical protein
LPKGFRSLPPSAALATLATALPTRRHLTLIREVFDENGPFGDSGAVRVFQLSGERRAVPREAPLSDLIDVDLNVDGPFALEAEGRPLRGRCELVDAAMDGRQATYRFTFTDIVEGLVRDAASGALVMREREEPSEVDAVIDFDRAVLAVHGGEDEHARRLRTLLAQALSTATDIVTFQAFDPLTDPMMHALIDGFDGWIPGGKVRPSNAKAGPLTYTTRDLSESRRNLSNVRTRREGEHVALRGVVMLARLHGRGRNRQIVFTLDASWKLTFKDRVEPLVYFRLFDEIRAQSGWGEWSRSPATIASEGLKAVVGAASTDLETQTRGDEYLRGVEITLGSSVPKGMSEFRRQVILIDLVNAIWQIARNAHHVPPAERVKISPGLAVLFDDVASVHKVLLDSTQRSAIVRAVARAIEKANGDRKGFFDDCQRLARL